MHYMGRWRAVGGNRREVGQTAPSPPRRREPLTESPLDVFLELGIHPKAEDAASKKLAKTCALPARSR